MWQIKVMAHVFLQRYGRDDDYMSWKRTDLGLCEGETSVDLSMNEGNVGRRLIDWCLNV